MRATAQDKDAAAMMGIDVDRTISFTFLVAGALAGVGGVIFAFYATTIGFDTGFTLGLFAFTAAVLGGIGNLPGAVLGALLIGLVQAFNEGLHVEGAGLEVDGVARVRDPDHHPRLPAARPARRAHAGGGLGDLERRGRAGLRACGGGSRRFSGGRSRAVHRRGHPRTGGRGRFSAARNSP